MKKKITVAVAGNPNSGKTTVFNALTGSRYKVGNYPGVTVEKKQGTVETDGIVITVVDLPGTYSLTAYSLEEVVARDFIVTEKPDLVVDIVDASNLSRNLYLTAQLMELGAPLVVCLNMMDLAEARGIEIDADRLSALLGVPVVQTVGTKRRGMDELLDVIVRSALAGGAVTPSEIRYGEEIEKEIARLSEEVSADLSDDPPQLSRWHAVKLLERDTEVEARFAAGENWGNIRSLLDEGTDRLRSILKEDPTNLIAEGRYGFINGVVRDSVVHVREDHIRMSDTIDRVVLSGMLGLPIFVGVMYLVFQAVFTWAEPLMNLVEEIFFFLGGFAAAVIPAGLVQDLVVDGIIAGVGGVLTFLPQIMFLFLFIAILEDSGYLARAAFIMDRVMSAFGLNGKAFVPLLSSFACAVPGIMATRTMESDKSRLVTMLIAPLMSCSARLPVYTLMIAALVPDTKIFGGTVGAQGFTLFSLYFGGVIMAMLMAILFKTTILKEESAPLVIELPPYRLPTVRSVTLHMWDKSREYVKKAGTVILAVSIVLWVLFSFPRIDEGLEGPSPTDPLAVAFFEETGIHPEAFETGGELEGVYAPYRAYDDAVSKIAEKREDTAGDGATCLADETILTSHLASVKARDPELYRALIEYREEYLPARWELEREREREQMIESFGGRLGRAIEPVFRPLGLDWRFSISLVSSFAAKEIFVAAMGTLYAVGGDSAEGSPNLIQSIRTDPMFEGNTGVLLAVVIMVFSLLSTPCLATVAVVKQESGTWRWPLFLIGYTFALAWIVCFLIWQTGRLFL
ncbi:MAG: ferrous iron transport protein B [Deltaproteobacteria bacterium]|nr:ferrous iron transport protein B [Candidatus Zymogenaceae bacterium]